MKIGIIGLGNMGGAILTGLINSPMENSDIFVYARREQSYKTYHNSKINFCETTEELIANVEVIILAIKPYDYPNWLSTYPLGDTILISIAAGVDSLFLQKYTNRFVIAMPNTPSVIGKGLTLLAKTPILSTDIAEIFLSIGDVKIIDEHLLPEYTLITGCSPAYFFNFVDNIVRATMRQTTIDDPDEIKQLTLNVMEGALEMMRTSEPSELCENVCSPGGVTIEVITKLERGLSTSLNEGFQNGLKRAKHIKDINEHFSSN